MTTGKPSRDPFVWRNWFKALRRKGGKRFRLPDEAPEAKARQMVADQRDLADLAWQLGVVECERAAVGG